MIVLKVISVAIDVRDCIGIFTDAENIKRILVNRYQGRCYAGCYIKEVCRVIRRGECMITLDGPPEFGTISVTFEARAVLFPPDEIIVGAVVKDRGPRGIICGTDLTNIIVANHAMLESITKGQLIPVRVGEARYTVSSSKVSINATLYLPSTVPVVHRIVPGAAVVTRRRIAAIMAQVQQEEAARAELIQNNAAMVKVFDKYLRAYKTVAIDLPGATEITIQELTQGDALMGDGSVWLVRDPRVDLSRGVVYRYTDVGALPALPANTTPIESSAAGAVVAMLEDYYTHLRVSREMVETYSTAELLKKHNNLWAIFAKNQAAD